MEAENAQARLIHERILLQSGELVRGIEPVLHRFEFHPSAFLDLVKPSYGLAVIRPVLAQVPLIKDAKTGRLLKGQAGEGESLALKFDGQVTAVNMDGTGDFSPVVSRWQERFA